MLSDEEVNIIYEKGLLGISSAEAPQHSPFWFERMRRADDLGPRNIRTVKPKAFAAPNGLPERNPVSVYKIYAQKARCNATARHPILSWHKPYSKLLFKSSALGMNKLKCLLKSMAEKAGFESRWLTNHSAWKRMIQKLNDMDIPPTRIMQISGRRNVQSINNYCHVSQQHKICR